MSLRPTSTPTRERLLGQYTTNGSPAFYMLLGPCSYSNLYENGRVRSSGGGTRFSPKIMFEQMVDTTGELEDILDHEPHTRRAGSYFLDFKFDTTTSTESSLLAVRTKVPRRETRLFVHFGNSRVISIL
jgi:hypothetical protein